MYLYLIICLTKAIKTTHKRRLYERTGFADASSMRRERRNISRGLASKLVHRRPRTKCRRVIQESPLLNLAYENRGYVQRGQKGKIPAVVAPKLPFWEPPHEGPEFIIPLGGKHGRILLTTLFYFVCKKIILKRRVKLGLQECEQQVQEVNGQAVCHA